MKRHFLINEQTIVNIDDFKTYFMKFHQRLQDKHKKNDRCQTRSLHMTFFILLISRHYIWR